MHLFKRLLLTKFPNSTIHNTVNPASMFVGFISAKEFFSIINRKIIENHKLNLFDINIDPIEFKTGFGEGAAKQKEKDLEAYFAYAAASNLNGYLFFSPANLGNGVALLSALYFRETMAEFPRYYFVQLVYTVYLFSFTFAARIKTFPSQNDQENYNWFIDVFFDFYKSTFKQLQTEISESDFLTVKKNLLQQTAFFFFLFYYYKKLNTLLEGKSSDEDYIDRLLGKRKEEKLISTFKENYEITKYQPHFNPLEQTVLNLIFPTDILIKYLFGDADPMVAVDTIITGVFDKTELDPIISSFLTSDEKLTTLLEYLLEDKKYKYGFFGAVQNYMIKLFRSEGKEDILEDIDEMLSAIDNGDDFSQFDMPEKIKRESKVTERLLNFYITLIGGFTAARGDSFYLRVFKPELLNFFTQDTLAQLLNSEIALEYFGNMFYQYGKNLYFYSYIDENIRAGKNKFTIPTQGNNIKATTNFAVVKLYTEAMISSFFQDINPKDSKLTIKNTQILELFKDKFGKSISQRVKLSQYDFLLECYRPSIGALSNAKKTFTMLDTLLTEKDRIKLKDSLYKLDYWLTYSFFEKLREIQLTDEYLDVLLLSIFGTIRETLFGIALLFSFLQKEKKIPFEKNELLLMIYIQDVLGIKIKKNTEILKMIKEVISDFSPFLELWIGLDDNKQFLEIIGKSWESFTHKKTDEEIVIAFNGEEIIWLRGVLKNITYYNKRFIIPR